jgi:hypothetical protein
MRRRHAAGEAAALSRYADQILGPRDAPPMIDAALDPALTATVRRLRALGRRPAPAAARERVWRDIAPTTAASPRDRSVSSLKGAPMFATTRPIPTRGVRRMPASPGRFGLPLAALAVALVLLALTAYAGFSRWRDGGPESSIPAAQVSTPADAAAVTPQPGAISSAIPPLPGCTTEPRAPGAAEQAIGQERTIIRLLPRGDGATYATALLDGDAYIASYTTGPARQSTIDAIDATLAQIDACRYYTSTSDGKADLNGRYFANFTDDYLTLQFAGLKDDPAVLERSFGWVPRMNEVSHVEQAWKTRDGRIMAAILPGPPLMNVTARTVMVFAEVGDRWLIDEVSPAMVFDELPEDVATPVRDDEHDLVPILIYDADAPRRPEIDGNYSSGFAADYPFLADGGLTIRLINLGTQPHRFVIAELDIDVTLQPGDLIDLPIDAPVGAYEWAIYEGDGTEPTATRSFELVPPGTLRGVG